MSAEPDQFLFSYGTLQQPDVQRDTFGRIVQSEDDVLPGYTVDYAEIEDSRVVELSGLAVHPIVRPTGDPRDKVVGRVLRVSDDELDAPTSTRCTCTVASRSRWPAGAAHGRTSRSDRGACSFASAR